MLIFLCFRIPVTLRLFHSLRGTYSLRWSFVAGEVRSSFCQTNLEFRYSKNRSKRLPAFSLQKNQSPHRTTAAARRACRGRSEATLVEEGMSSSATQKLTAFLVNPVVRVAQATAILHCINNYAFGITAVRNLSHSSGLQHRQLREGLLST